MTEQNRKGITFDIIVMVLSIGMMVLTIVQSKIDMPMVYRIIISILWIRVIIETVSNLFVEIELIAFRSKNEGRQEMLNSITQAMKLNEEE